MNEDVETLGDVLIDHGPSGFINSRKGFVKCLCGARLYCAFEDGQPDYAYEAAARAEHLAVELAPLLDQARRNALAPVLALREVLRDKMLAAPITDDHDTYGDGYGSGLSVAVGALDDLLGHRAVASHQEGGA